MTIKNIVQEVSAYLLSFAQQQKGLVSIVPDSSHFPILTNKIQTFTPIAYESLLENPEEADFIEDMKVDLRRALKSNKVWKQELAILLEKIKEDEVKQLPLISNNKNALINSHIHIKKGNVQVGNNRVKKQVNKTTHHTPICIGKISNTGIVASKVTFKGKNVAGRDMIIKKAKKKRT